MTAYTIVESPIGDLLVTGDRHAVSGLFTRVHPMPGARRDDAAFSAVAAQLDEYFAGERTAFELELELAGTPFQQRVWAELRRVPYGETISYAELADRIGRPGAARAVGHCNARNPVSIVVPCHRVIGSAGALTGYAGGLERKRALLALESGYRRAPAPVMPSDSTSAFSSADHVAGSSTPVTGRPEAA
jgi:methylated-DNA-[protein]-cysteine S-methyltransferase